MDLKKKIRKKSPQLIQKSSHILVAKLFLCCMWLPAIACSSVMWAHGQAGQGCGELEMGPAAASLGQQLMAGGG